MNKKRLLAIIMTVMLIVALLPLSTFAEGDVTTGIVTDETTGATYTKIYDAFQNIPAGETRTLTVTGTVQAGYYSGTAAYLPVNSDITIKAGSSDATIIGTIMGSANANAKLTLGDGNSEKPLHINGSISMYSGELITKSDLSMTNKGMCLQLGYNSDEISVKATIDGGSFTSTDEAAIVATRKMTIINSISNATVSGGYGSYAGAITCMNGAGIGPISNCDISGYSGIFNEGASIDEINNSTITSTSTGTSSYCAAIVNKDFKIASYTGTNALQGSIGPITKSTLSGTYGLTQYTQYPDDGLNSVEKVDDCDVKATYIGIYNNNGTIDEIKDTDVTVKAPADLMSLGIYNYTAKSEIGNIEGGSVTTTEGNTGYGIFNNSGSITSITGTLIDSKSIGINNRREASIGTVKNVTVNSYGQMALNITTGASVDTVYGGKYTGATDAVTLNNGTLNTIMGASIFYGKSGYAINNAAEPDASQINIEPELNDDQPLQGYARYYGSEGVAKNNHFADVDDTYPLYGAGTANEQKYFMSTGTTSVKGFDGVDFHYLTLNVKVEYDKNAIDATGDMKDDEYSGEWKEDLKIAANRFERDDYTFTGWNTESDGEGASYSAGDAVDKTDLKLYAQWRQNIYNVTVTDDGNGTGMANPTSGTMGTEVTLTAKPDDDYRFKEWLVIEGGVTVNENKFRIGGSDVVVQATFEPIAPADIKTAEVTAADQTYDGTEKNPVPTVTWNGKTLTEGTDYDVTAYAGNKDAGDATVTVTGKGNFTGTANGTFKIAPAKATITVDNASKVEGASDPVFTGKVEGLIADGDLGDVTYSRTVGDEAPGTYKGVLTAAYTDNPNYNVTVTKGDFTIKKVYDVVWIDGDGGELDRKPWVEGETEPTTDKKATKNADAQFTYTFSEWNAGEWDAAHTVKTYKPQFNKTVNKYRATPIPPDDISTATVTASDQTYDGTEKKPVPTVTWNGKTLAEGTDYDVTAYAGNKDAGDATVTVTGKGNFTGTANGTFKIAPAKATITVDNASKVEGESDPVFTGTVEGLIADGDLGEITYSREGSDEAPGTYKGVLTANYTDNPNYDVTVTNGDFTITQKPADTPTYKAVSGSGGTYTKGSGKTLTFTYKRSTDDGATFGHFKGITVDGKAVPEKDSSGKANWTAKSGSVIIELQSSYLETLSVGEHKLAVQFDDGADATSTFTVKAKPATPTVTPTKTPTKAANTSGKATTTAVTTSGKATTTAPKTGDESNMLLWFLLICASLFVMFRIISLRNRRFNDR